MPELSAVTEILLKLTEAASDPGEREALERLIDRAGVRPPVERIRDRGELVELAKALRVRYDWHEPGEQGLTARVEGRSFNNAGCWPTSDCPRLSEEVVEMHVILTKHGTDVAAINLATLLGWASEEVTCSGSCY